MTTRIIVGIDFGAVYSKVSWAVGGTDKQVHLVDDWPDPTAPNAVRERVPSSVSYNSKGELCDWGYNQGKHTIKVNCFKLLVESIDLDDLRSELRRYSRDLLAYLPQSSFDVISDYLRCIWNHTKAHISRHRGDHWEMDFTPSVILTVPDKWGIVSTRWMTRIALHAGLPRNITTIPETESTARALFEGLNPEKQFWWIGDVIIVCDAGGYTVSITSYQIISLRPFKTRKLVGTADFCGSTLLNTYFEDIVRTTIGPYQYDSFSPMLKVEIFEAFEVVKERFPGCQAEKFTLHLSNVKNNEADEVWSQSIPLSRPMLRKIFNNVCKRIVRGVNDEIEEARSRRLGVKAVFLTGGFGSSEYLYDWLQQSCGAHGVRVLLPGEVWSATCRGATLWGLQHPNFEPKETTFHDFFDSEVGYQDTESPKMAIRRASFSSERTFWTAQTSYSTMTLESTITFESAISDARRFTFGSRVPVNFPRDPRYYGSPARNTFLPVSSSNLNESQSSVDAISRNRRPQYRVLIASPGDFELCREPWSLSALSTWLKSICEKLESFQRHHLVTAMEALLSLKAPAIPLEYVEILSEQIIHRLESGVDPAVIWYQGQGWWTSNQCSGVLPELTGRGCYSPRLHTVSSKAPLACYSVLCCSAQSMSPWLKCLRSFNLIPGINKEQNWSGRGQHAEFSAKETLEVPLVYERHIGSGASGSVDSVRCGRIRLARKTIRFNRRLKREDAVKEVAHLQLLSHAHLVQVIGTYVFINNRQNLQILLYPVAECDLEEFMESICEEETAETEQRSSCLSSFFPCLVNAVAYIHGNCIKHMDIKPQNILVRDMRKSSLQHFAAFKVYLADFGIARAYASPEDAETSSPTAFTRIYAAPEVVAQATRGFSADIFSLGCIFAEMVAVMSRRRDELEDVRRNSFQENLEPTCLFLCRLLRPWAVGNIIDIWIEEVLLMLEHHPPKRPSAHEIRERVALCQIESCCCSPDELEAASELA